MLAISKDLKLPDDVTSQTTAILGIRGSGKTTTAKVIVEEIAKRREPFVWIDPLDVAWGLKSSRDGKRPGFPVIVAGGAHGDIPLAENDGATIADFAVEHHVPIILSLRHLRKGAQRRFVTDFAEQLYHRKGESKHRTPLPVILDECDSFVPQRVGGTEARMVGAIEDLVRRGRAAGIGVILISQRAASVNKDVLTQLELLVAHRHTSPQDRAALALWIEAHDTEDREEDFMGSLASLAVGRAWFWSPALNIFKQVQVREPTTFDSSATPKAGQQARAPSSLAEVDLESIKSKLAQTIEQARADDPRELRKQIADLKKQLGAKPAAAEPKEFREFMASATTKIKTLTLAVKERDDTIVRLRRMMDKVYGALEGLDHSAIADPSPVSPSQTLPAGKNGESVAGSVARPALDKAPAPVNQAPPVVHKPRGCVNETGTEQLGNSGLRRMMIALAQRPGLTKAQLGLRAGLSSKSGTFGTYLGTGRRNGWIEGMQTLRLTDMGLNALGEFEPLPTGRDLLRYWLGELGQSGAARMLQALADVYPQALPKEGLGEAAGMSAASGTFGTYLGTLRRLELVQGRGELRASDELFD